MFGEYYGDPEDIASLRRELGRIEAALPTDPSAAISKAKTLMEIVAKRVVIESGDEIATDRNFAALTSQAAHRFSASTATPPPAITSRSPPCCRNCTAS